MRKYIRAEVQNLAKNEALAMIPVDTLERIKRTDKKPEIKVYAIAHEGTAHASELAFGAKLKKAFSYVKDMIVKIGEKLELGTPIFNRHIDTNENSGREQIGEVVGKTIKYIGDKLSALAAIYIYPPYKKIDLDVASFEANIEYIPKSKEKAEVIDVDEITGIALSNSAIDEPAFKGATLLGVVQAFIQPESDEDILLAKVKAIRKSIKSPAKK
ncbi:hypothetical protein FJZ33_00080 [Candidatus Poribacteria bacterium]|nr:hypothetical protein [Candidatus Poribacteria bacterium]